VAYVFHSFLQHNLKESQVVAGKETPGGKKMRVEMLRMRLFTGLTGNSMLMLAAICFLAANYSGFYTFPGTVLCGCFQLFQTTFLFVCYFNPFSSFFPGLNFFFLFVAIASAMYTTTIALMIYIAV